jgi:glyoxylase-like metal-dependent hydrolase (beta-lactamase superfamily II)
MESWNSVEGPVYMIDPDFHGRKGVLSSYVIKGFESVLIDPGPTSMSPGVTKGLRDLQINVLKYVAITHIHLDHAGGSWKIMEEYPASSIYVHPKGSEHIINPQRLKEAARSLLGGIVDLYGEIRGIPLERVIESTDNDKMDLSGNPLDVIWTPGHSSHSQSYLQPDHGVLILGDAGGRYIMEEDIILPTSPPPFNPVKAVESIEKLIKLKPEIVCYSHFGYADSGVEMLKDYKRQIKTWNNLAEESLTNGLNPKETLQRLRAADHMVDKALIKKVETEKEILYNLKGFIEYVKWMKKRDE